jgi:tRNA dimethylallyltransferase
MPTMHSNSLKPKVIVIVGPTASGKTGFSLHLAEKIKSKTGKEVEIISADSRQVYRHIPIATAQPAKEELKKFKHHFINTNELDDIFNAGEFGIKGRELIKKIFKKGNIPIVVGGSGLYIRSLIYGLFESGNEVSEDKQKQVRAELYKELEKSGLNKLINELKKADPDTLNAMPNITERRVIRALEVFYSTGVPISVHRTKKIEIDFEPVQIGLNMDRKILYDRINKRVDEMVEAGLINEVKSLQKKGYHYKTHSSLNTVGIKEVFDYLEGIITYEKMLELIKQNSRRYAKRQLTWFRKDKSIEWIQPEDTANYKIPSLN